jgi:hypothetical protein
VRRVLNLPKKKDEEDNEREPLLSQHKVIDGSPVKKKTEAPRIRDVLTYQTTLNLLVYTILALYMLAFDLVS